MKDPAFLFYSQDFLVGTLTMSFEDKGKYITILAYMHQQGRLDEKTISLLVGSISDNLRLKFSVDESGLLFNKKLESEIEKRVKFSESRRNNGLQGGRPKKETEQKESTRLSLGLASANLVENENENKDIIKKGVANFIKPSYEEIKQYCIERKNNVDPNKFLNFYEAKGWMIGKNKMKDWKASIRTWESKTQQETKYSNNR
jgi:hypothetical protein